MRGSAGSGRASSADRQPPRTAAPLLDRLTHRSNKGAHTHASCMSHEHTSASSFGVRCRHTQAVGSTRALKSDGWMDFSAPIACKRTARCHTAPTYAGRSPRISRARARACSGGGRAGLRTAVRTHTAICGRLVMPWGLYWQRGQPTTPPRTTAKHPRDHTRPAGGGQPGTDLGTSPPPQGSAAPPKTYTLIQCNPHALNPDGDAETSPAEGPGRPRRRHQREGFLRCQGPSPQQQARSPGSAGVREEECSRGAGGSRIPRGCCTPSTAPGRSLIGET